MIFEKSQQFNQDSSDLKTELIAFKSLEAKAGTKPSASDTKKSADSAFGEME